VAAATNSSTMPSTASPTKYLTDTLRRAERDGLITRRLDPERIESATLYELTDLGRSLWDLDPPRTPSLFEPQVIASVVGVLSEHLPALSPRDVMNAFDAILREADLDIEEGTIATIEEAYALARIPESDSGQAS
jgi:DNA-binding MarR family transcriptional regulator